MVGRVIVALGLALLLGVPEVRAERVSGAPRQLTVAQSDPDEGDPGEVPLSKHGKRKKSIFDEADAPPPAPPAPRKRARKAAPVSDDVTIDDGTSAPLPPKKKRKKQAPPPEDAIDADAPKAKSPPPDEAPLEEPPPKKRVEDEAPPRKPASDDDAAPPKKRASDDDDGASKRKSADDEDAPKKHKKSDDEDEDAPRKHKKSDDEDGESAKKSEGEDKSGDESLGVHAGWGAVAGHPPNGQMVFGEVGLPGVRALYLVSKGDNFAYGGGGEIDFPPLSFSGSSPRGFNALRFIGRLDYYLPTDVVQIYVHFEPQWIAIIGDSNYGGLFYMPVEAGVGFDAGPAHLGIGAGAGLQFTGGSLFFPFTGLVASSPFVGVGGELPLSDSLAVTLRARLQTYAWDTPGPDRSPTLIGLGFLAAGVAYRY